MNIEIINKSEAIKNVKIVIDGKTYDIEITTSIGLTEMREITDSVLTMVFGKNDEYYNSWIIDFAIQYLSLLYLTNIDLPDDYEDIHEIMKKINPRELFEKNVPELYGKIIHVVNDSILFKKEQISKRSKIDTLIEYINGVIDAFKEKIKESNFDEVINIINNKEIDENSNLLSDIKDVIEAIGKRENEEK